MDAIRNSARAIIIRDGRLLLIRNRDEEGDWYVLPGGGQRPGESLLEALQRECHEEFGAHVQIGGIRMIREYIGRHHEFAEQDGNVHQVDFMFECQVDPAYHGGTGQTPDALQTGVAWIALSDLPYYRLYPQVLSTILRNGIAEQDCMYLGDVN